MDKREKEPKSDSMSRAGGTFPPTAWSMVCQLQGDDSEAVDRAWGRLARGYWQPLYAFLRQRGADHHSACDDVQGFFAHLLSKTFIRRIEPGDGLFRSFLLNALQNWRADQYRASVALKRGGGQVPVPVEEAELEDAMHEYSTPEDAYVCFMRTGIDTLVLDDFVLEKSAQPAWEEDADWQTTFTPD